MITIVIVLLIWNLLLTGCLVGLLFRTNALQGELDSHVRILSTIPTMVDLCVENNRMREGEGTDA